MKVLILSASTGEGHNSAAKALQEYFNKQNIETIIKDVLYFNNEKTGKMLEGIYNSAILHSPSSFGLLYSIGRFYDNLKLPSPVYYCNARLSKNLNSYINENKFDVVIAVHIYGMEALTGVKRKFKSKIPFFGILTDYTSIPFYKDTHLDGYFIGAPCVKDDMKKHGVKCDNIITSGIPTSLKFTDSYDINLIKEELKIPKDKNIITILSGGGGVGHVDKILDLMFKKSRYNDHIFIFTGHNKKLKYKLEEKYRYIPQVSIIAFTTMIDKYIKCSDVVLSKPGGLSSTELAVLNTPLVHLKAIPGCETANYKFFLKNNMSLYGSSVKKAVSYAFKLVDDKELANTLMENQRKTILNNSCQIILDSINNFIKEN